MNYVPLSYRMKHPNSTPRILYLIKQIVRLVYLDVKTILWDLGTGSSSHLLCRMWDLGTGSSSRCGIHGGLQRLLPVPMTKGENEKRDRSIIPKSGTRDLSPKPL